MPDLRLSKWWLLSSTNTIKYEKFYKIEGFEYFEDYVYGGYVFSKKSKGEQKEKGRWRERKEVTRRAVWTIFFVGKEKKRKKGRTKAKRKTFFLFS